MWQTSFYLFGSIGMVWSLIWISLYSDKDCRNNDELPLVMIPKVSLYCHHNYRAHNDSLILF